MGKTRLLFSPPSRLHPTCGLLNCRKLTPKPTSWQGSWSNDGHQEVPTGWSQTPCASISHLQGQDLCFFSRRVQSLQSPLGRMWCYQVLAWQGTAFGPWMWKYCSVMRTNKLLWVLGESEWRGGAQEGECHRGWGLGKKACGLHGDR